MTSESAPAPGLPDPDIDLAARVASGDSAAFEPIMRRHNRMLFRAARAILKNDAEAEDALQEAYLAAYRAMHTYRGQAKLSTWLARIVINEALGRLRKHSREQLNGFFTPDDAGDDRPEYQEDPMSQDAPENAAARAETRRLLERKLDELPATFRTVFVLRAVEEMSVEETAQSLGIPEATVRTRFFRARSLLRESLARDIDTVAVDAFAFAGERCDRVVAGVLRRLSGRDP